MFSVTVRFDGNRWPHPHCPPGDRITPVRLKTAFRVQSSQGKGNPALLPDPIPPNQCMVGIDVRAVGGGAWEGCGDPEALVGIDEIDGQVIRFWIGLRRRPVESAVGCGLV